jgi:hypothetical protein
MESAHARTIHSALLTYGARVAATVGRNKSARVREAGSGARLSARVGVREAGSGARLSACVGVRERLCRGLRAVRYWAELAIEAQVGFIPLFFFLSFFSDFFSLYF